MRFFAAQGRLTAAGDGSGAVWWRTVGKICRSFGPERVPQAGVGFVRSRRGGRVYAEGGGLAYICRSMMYGGQLYPMAGLLPAVATYQPVVPKPVELRTCASSWLAPSNRPTYVDI